MLGKITGLIDGKIIIEVSDGYVRQGYDYVKLGEINEEWEDYEEPKEYYFIAGRGDVEHSLDRGDIYDIKHKDMDNYFETKEEAERAVEKLKAWKRLKDKGFKFRGWTIDDGLKISIQTNTDEDDIYDEDKRMIKSELDLLFGGEE